MMARILFAAALIAALFGQPAMALRGTRGGTAANQTLNPGTLGALGILQQSRGGSGGGGFGGSAFKLFAPLTLVTPLASVHASMAFTAELQRMVTKHILAPAGLVSKKVADAVASPTRMYPLHQPHGDITDLHKVPERIDPNSATQLPKSIVQRIKLFALPDDEAERANKKPRRVAADGQALMEQDGAMGKVAKSFGPSRKKADIGANFRRNELDEMFDGSDAEEKEAAPFSVN